MPRTSGRPNQLVGPSSRQLCDDGQSDKAMREGGWGVSGGGPADWVWMGWDCVPDGPRALAAPLSSPSAWSRARGHSARSCLASLSGTETHTVTRDSFFSPSCQLPIFFSRFSHRHSTFSYGLLPLLASVRFASHLRFGYLQTLVRLSTLLASYSVSASDWESGAR